MNATTIAAFGRLIRRVNSQTVGAVQNAAISTTYRSNFAAQLAAIERVA
jgi:hypothetical protein